MLTGALERANREGLQGIHNAADRTSTSVSLLPKHLFDIQTWAVTNAWTEGPCSGHSTVSFNAHWQQCLLDFPGIQLHLLACRLGECTYLASSVASLRYDASCEGTACY